MFPSSKHIGGKKGMLGFEIGIMMNDKWVNWSYGFAQTKQQVG